MLRLRNYTYGHRLVRTGHPVRSAILKHQIGRSVLSWVGDHQRIPTAVCILSFCTRSLLPKWRKGLVLAARGWQDSFSNLTHQCNGSQGVRSTLFSLFVLRERHYGKSMLDDNHTNHPLSCCLEIEVGVYEFCNLGYFTTLQNPLCSFIPIAKYD